METLNNRFSDVKIESSTITQDLHHKNISFKNIAVISACHDHSQHNPQTAGESDLFSQLFYLNPNATVLSNSDDGTIIAANEAFYATSGFREHEALGRSSICLGLWPDVKEREGFKKQIINNNGNVSSIPLKLRLKNGEMHEFLAYATLIISGRGSYLLSIMIPTDSQKRIEQTLSEHRRQTEDLSDQIRKMKTAIRVFGDEWCKEKAAIQNRMRYHINVNVLPFIEKIRKVKEVRHRDSYLRIIEDNLQDLNPIFTEPRVYAEDDFTPSESQIIQLIKHGKSSKEIAKLLNLSTKAISFHRSNIRKKLNLLNKKINLATFLRSQELRS